MTLFSRCSVTNIAESVTNGMVSEAIVISDCRSNVLEELRLASGGKGMVEVFEMIGMDQMQ